MAIDSSEKNATASSKINDDVALHEPTTAELGHDKPFFRIGEVAAILGVPAHVLRYWESEFAVVRPRKSKNQQRVYRRQDVDNLLRIKHLLYERKFTVAGAQQELQERAQAVPCAAPTMRYRLEQSLEHVTVCVQALAAVVRRDPLAPQAADPAAYLRRGDETP